jgi:hypothetical protein
MSARIKFLIGCILAILIVFPPISSTTVLAKDKKVKSGQVKAQKSRGEGKDENIKSKSEANDPKTLPEAPPAKGGNKTRGTTLAIVTFDNYTAYKIQLFANGEYIGLVPAWGKVYSYATEGNVILYGRADFTSGDVLTWGPTTITLSAGDSYTWNLR